MAEKKVELGQHYVAYSQRLHHKQTSMAQRIFKFKSRQKNREEGLPMAVSYREKGESIELPYIRKWGGDGVFWLILLWMVSYPLVLLCELNNHNKCNWAEMRLASGPSLARSSPQASSQEQPLHAPAQSSLATANHTTSRQSRADRNRERSTIS